jgi:hypothetical protein
MLYIQVQIHIGNAGPKTLIEDTVMGEIKTRRGKGRFWSDFTLPNYGRTTVTDRRRPC